MLPKERRRFPEPSFRQGRQEACWPIAAGSPPPRSHLLRGSAALFPFAAAFPAIGMLAAFLFNFTMPVTLISLANLMPASKGITFGIASFSLAIGTLPALIGFDVDGPMALSVLAIASLACLLPALRLARDIQDEPDTQAKIARAEGRA